MRFCSECGKQLPDDAKFCSGCGKATEPQQQTPATGSSVPATNQDWYTLSGITSQPPKLLGVIGSVLAFISVFLPWANIRAQLPVLDGFDMGGMMPGMQNATMEAHTQLGWLIVLVAIAGLIAIFKRGAGMIVILAGGLIAIYALFSLIMVSLDNGSPSFGIVLSLAGGAMMLYSGLRAPHTDKA